MALRLVDDELRVVAAEIRLEHHGDGGLDVVLVVAGTAAELSAAFRGPVPALRRRRSGLLLSPGPGDADLLGIRLPRTPVPTRPGSGWLVVAGSAQRVQVARRHPPEGTPVPAPAGSGACSAAW